MKARAFPLILAVLWLVPLSLGAEVTSSVTIAGYNVLLYSGNPDNPVGVRAVLNGSLNLDATDNENVKAYFQLDSMITDEVNLDVPRAYIKVRFPWFRLTLGKTRVSWGDGFVFNAADVIFTSMGAVSGDLFADSLRDETAWLGAVYIPLGLFSFLEGVFLPYDPVGSGSAAYPVSGGGRAVVKIDRIRTTLETGYLASGPYGEHRPYISLHGHLLVDWNLSASMSIPMNDPQWQQWRNWLAVSAGLFHLIDFGPFGSLSFRLETAIRPGPEWWTEKSATEAKAAWEPGAPTYGLYLFPEIVFAPSDTWSLQLRSIILPEVDGSGVLISGLSWNIYQGLDVFSYLSLMAGDANDLYRWDDYGSWSLTTGFEFVY